MICFDYCRYSARAIVCPAGWAENVSFNICRGPSFLLFWLRFILDPCIWCVVVFFAARDTVVIGWVRVTVIFPLCHLCRQCRLVVLLFARVYPCICRGFGGLLICDEMVLRAWAYFRWWWKVVRLSRGVVILSVEDGHDGLCWRSSTVLIYIHSSLSEDVLTINQCWPGP